MKARIGTVLAIVGLLHVDRIDAQNLPDPGAVRPQDPACQNALAAVLAAPATISADSLGLLIASVGPCRPELGRAAGGAIRTFATTGSDAHAAVAFGITPPFVDSAVHAAARDVAASPAATEVMRLFALKTLFFYLDREQDPAYSALTSQVRGARSCALARTSDVSRTDIFGDYTPLPPNYRGEARAVAVAIQGDAGASSALQSASYCVLEAWRRVMGRPGNAHWPFSQSSLTVDYVCGNRFRLRNQHPVELSLEWQVGTLPLRTVGLAARPTGQSFSERILDAGQYGDLRLYLDGDLFITRPNGSVSCP